MNLNDLMIATIQADAILTDAEALNTFLKEKDSFSDLFEIFLNQVDNKLSETILLLDNYIIIDDEEVSLLEAQLRQHYLVMILQRG